MNLRDVADAIALTLEPIGWNVFAEVRPKASLPVVMVGWLPTGTYDYTFDGCDEAVFDVHFCVSGQDDVDARHKLDSVLSRGTEDSVKDMLEALGTPLAVVVGSVRVTGWDAIDGLTINEVPAYGYSVHVEVID